MRPTSKKRYNTRIEVTNNKSVLILKTAYKAFFSSIKIRQHHNLSLNVVRGVGKVRGGSYLTDLDFILTYGSDTDSLDSNFSDGFVETSGTCLFFSCFIL